MYFFVPSLSFSIQVSRFQSLPPRWKTTTLTLGFIRWKLSCWKEHERKQQNCNNTKKSFRTKESPCPHIDNIHANVDLLQHFYRNTERWVMKSFNFLPAWMQHWKKRSPLPLWDLRLTFEKHIAFCFLWFLQSTDTSCLWQLHFLFNKKNITCRLSVEG